MNAPFHLERCWRSDHALRRLRWWVLLLAPLTVWFLLGGVDRRIGALGYDSAVQRIFAQQGTTMPALPTHHRPRDIFCLGVLPPLLWLLAYGGLNRWRREVVLVGAWGLLLVAVLGTLAFVLEIFDWWRPVVCYAELRVKHRGRSIAAWRPLGALVAVGVSAGVSALLVYRRKRHATPMRVVLILQSAWLVYGVAYLLPRTLTYMFNWFLLPPRLRSPQRGWTTWDLCGGVLGAWLALACAGVLWCGLPRYVYRWLAYAKVRRGRRAGKCMKCGYNLMGSLQAGQIQCPECGWSIPAYLGSHWRAGS